MTFNPSTRTSAVAAAILTLTTAQGAFAEASVAEGVTIGLAQLSAAKSIQKKYEPELLHTPGVTAVGLGLDETGKKLALHVFVNSKAIGASAFSAAAQVEGLPVRITESGEIKALGNVITPLDAGPQHRLQYTTPVPMGVSTGNDNGCFAGTLGARVIRIGQPSKVGYITNAHVAAAGGTNLCAGSAAFGEDQFQRGFLDAVPQCSNKGLKKIGDLVQHVPLAFGGNFENTVDAVFVASSRTLVDKKILDIGNPSASLLEPALNMPVQKSGRTTGLQFGNISSINATVLVDYGCGIAKFVNQTIIGPGGFSAGGDSGSLILHKTLKDSAGRYRPVGLLFAGSNTITVANRIGDVLGALSATIDIQ